MAEEVKTEQVKVHKTSTSMAQAAAADLDAGTDVALKVRVTCPEKCDLAGGQVKIVDAQEEAVREIELTEFDETANETAEFVTKAPISPGEYTWTAVFAAPEKDGVLHEASSAPFSFRVKPHATSMAVWDAPTPITLGARFKLKVGVSCPAGCKLAGQPVAIYDHAGAQVETSKLGDAPWSGTTGLYWTEVEVTAPSTEGFLTWEARFPKPELELAHEAAANSFAFRTAKPPEHIVTIEAVDRRNKAPLEGAVVTLHSAGTTYRKDTDAGGVAKLSVPKGDYQLTVLKIDYTVLETLVKVAGDTEFKAELIYWPEDFE